MAGRLKTTWPDETDVERSLQYNATPADPPHDKRAECRLLSRAIKRFQPEVVYFWNQAGLCFWLPIMACWQGCPQAFFSFGHELCLLADRRMAGWPGPKKRPDPRPAGRDTFLVRGWPVVENQVCHFASEFLRTVAAKNGIPIAPKESLVAHWGIDQSQFPIVSRPRWPVKRLLYVGQMIRQKGVHTAIEAVALLAKDPPFASLTLTLVGGAYLPDYENDLRKQTAQLGLNGRVIFRGKIPRTELSRVYAEHDALIFPSEWDEPFAITPLEAIASGLAVVGTTTGGSAELFQNRETAMTFRAADAADCARAIRELSAPIRRIV